MGVFDRLSRKKKFRLAEVVELTSIDIFACSTETVRTFVQRNAIPEISSDPERVDQKAWYLVLELMVFSLHLADRIAFGILGHEKRTSFIDALLDSCSSNLSHSILTDISSESMQNFHFRFLSLYEERSELYASLQFQSPGGAPTEGKLFREAAKEVARVHFPGDVSSVALTLSVMFSLCVDGIKDLGSRLGRVRDL